MSSQQKTTLVGQQIGNYRLVSLLGKGAFATVYEGEHIHLPKKVAIKVLHAWIAEKYDNDFLSEAKTLALLDHLNIVKILDFGMEKDTPYLIMEYVSGSTTLPSRQILQVATIDAYLSQICAGLQFAHDKKIIHRDIKPANILRDDKGKVLVSDFGISALVHSTRSIVTQDVKGTPAYCAPEQMSGKPEAVSDQYSVGIMLYEWLTGTLPFTGASLSEIAIQHLMAPVPVMAAKGVSVDPGIEDVVRRALSKDPKVRYANMIELSKAFSQAAMLRSVGSNGGAISMTDPEKDQVTIVTAVDAVTYYNKGAVLNNLGYYADAIVWFDKALELNPRYGDAYDNKGVSLVRLGYYQNAISCFDRALELDPNDAEASYNKGVALAILGRPQNAIACYDRALRLNPRYVDAYNNKGVALKQLGYFQDAIACYDRALSINPNDANAHVNKGNVLVQLGYYADAIACYDRALFLNPNDAEAYQNKVYTLTNFGGGNPKRRWR